jgi:hypothetical protein
MAKKEMTTKRCLSSWKNIETKDVYKFLETWDISDFRKDNVIINDDAVINNRSNATLKL